MAALLPQRLSLAFKYAQVDGILTPSEMSCLNAECTGKDLAEFSPHPRSVLSFPSFQLLSCFSSVSSCSGEGVTHNTLSVGKEWTLFSCCTGVLSRASRKQSCKCICVFRCFKTQHCPIHFFPRQYATIGWQRLLIGYSRSTRQPPTLYEPLLGGCFG